jgi:hypothetical protein
MSTAKLRAELEKLKLRVAELTQDQKSVLRVIEPEPLPADSPDTLVIYRRFVKPTR